MHISRLDLNLFVVFEAIYTEGGVTRAGKRLNLTQPAISHSLGRLREILGDPLFHRQGHDMTPTPLARSIIEPIRQALRTMSAVIGDSGVFNAAASKRLFTVGLRDVMESVVLTPLMLSLAETAPGVGVSSVRIIRSDLARELASGQLDAAVDILMPTSQDIRHALISTDRLAVVARRDHPFVREGLTIDTYLEQEHVLVSSRRIGFGLADLEVARVGRYRAIKLRCQQSFAACRVVAKTNLILTMPDRYARIANVLFDNQIIAAPFDGPSQDVYVYWHANADMDPANKWLRDQLFSAFEIGVRETGAAFAS